MKEQLVKVRDGLLVASEEARKTANAISDFVEKSYWQGKNNAYGEVVNLLNKLIEESE